MNKKFLSAILFGALMVTSTGTFVSCKDYDDDIENLQGQINTLATKSDVEAKLSQLQSAIDAAKAEALAAVKDADESAEIAALEAKLANLETCKCDVDAMMAKIQDAVDADMAKYKEEIEALVTEVEVLVGKVADFVTEVELIYSYYQQNQRFVTRIPNFYADYGWEDKDKVIGSTAFSYPMYSDYFDFTPIFKDGKSEPIIIEDILSDSWVEYMNKEHGKGDFLYWEVNYRDQKGYDGQFLTYKTVFEKDNVFGKDLTGEMTFTKDTQVQRTVDFVVRVSPTNAVLTEDMISLVNSKGEKNPLIEIVDVQPYTGLLSRSAGNGLWVVTTKLTEYVKDEFNAVAADANGKSVLFAVAANNTLSSAPERNVVSSYDISINQMNYVGQAGLYFWVDQTHVKDINNRYNTSSISLENPDSDADAEINYYELEWKNYVAAVAATNLNTDGSPKDNSNTVNGDDRSAYKPYPAVQGKAITISLDASNWNTYANRTTPDVKAMYITLDKKANAIESAPSEWNVWNKYEIDGLDKVVEGTTAQITINGEETINDVIGFRVYAVNHDGTLVDPDGKAFYVRLGDVADAWSAAATTIVPVNPTVAGTQSDRVAVTLTELSAPSYAKWSTDAIKINNVDKKPVFHTVFVDVDANGKETILYQTTSENDFSKADFSKVDKVYTVAADGFAWTDYVDDKTYNGVLRIYNKTDHMIAELEVSFTKELPETVPAGFSVKTNQLVDNVYNCYLVPFADGEINWEANKAEEGKMDMDHVFNWGTKAEVGRYEIIFAGTEWDKVDKVLDPLTVYGNKDLVVAKDYTDGDGVVKAIIDNTTEHATTVVYNYGAISSALWNADEEDFEDYKVKATEFTTVYNCIYNDTYSWRWATHEDLGHTYDAETETWSGDVINTTLTYGGDKTTNKVLVDVDANIKGVSSRDGLYSAFFTEPYLKSLTIEKAYLVSDGNKVVDEYFKVLYTKGTTTITGFEATQISTETNPTAPVASTLVIEAYDMYGHIVTIELPMTVNPR